MTNEEAVYCLSRTECADCKYLIPCTNNGDGSFCFEAQTIGKNAIEKQIPKKPVGVDFDMVGCVSCKMVVVKTKDNYCPHCGQKQDWSEDD